MILRNVHQNTPKTKTECNHPYPDFMQKILKNFRHKCDKSSSQNHQDIFATAGTQMLIFNPSAVMFFYVL